MDTIDLIGWIVATAGLPVILSIFELVDIIRERKEYNKKFRKKQDP